MTKKQVSHAVGARSKSPRTKVATYPVGTPNPVDIHVGSRIRQRRTLLGMSQEKLGRAVSLTFQQIQKYERGANRVGASRLFQLSRILDVPVSYFYDEMTDAVKNIEHNDQETEGYKSDPLSRRETLELVRAYYRIDNLRVRKRIFELVKSVARLNADE